MKLVHTTGGNVDQTQKHFKTDKMPRKGKTAKTMVIKDQILIIND